MNNEIVYHSSKLNNLRDLDYFKEASIKKYDSILSLLNEVSKEKLYKDYLKIINYYILEEYLINAYIQSMLDEKINNNQYLSDKEKRYLLMKIEGYRFEFIKNISKGYYNIFKLSKYLIDYELIYQYLYGMKSRNRYTEKLKSKLKNHIFFKIYF